MIMSERIRTFDDTTYDMILYRDRMLMSCYFQASILLRRMSSTTTSIIKMRSRHSNPIITTTQVSALLMFRKSSSWVLRRDS